LPTHTEKGFFMLTARASSRTDLEHLTQSIHVIDALEESENADWKEIILLGFQNDQSDLLNFETLCHSTGRQMLTDATRTYTFETGLDST
jgi:1,2-phenylacetyl-CoA epoxidase catalytic subunit